MARIPPSLLMNTRALHRRLAPVIFVLLSLSAITALTYRLGKKWFGMDGQTGQQILDIHTGGWLGSAGSAVYIYTVGIGVLLLVGTGVLLLRSKAKRPVRRSHRILGGVLLLPLAATAATGILYHAGQSIFSFSEETNDILMSIHEGGWLGHELKVYYVLFLGTGTLAMGLLGTILLFRRSA